jgi:hypothetical protein
VFPKIHVSFGPRSTFHKSIEYALCSSALQYGVDVLKKKAEEGIKSQLTADNIVLELRSSLTAMFAAYFNSATPVLTVEMWQVS